MYMELWREEVHRGPAIGLNSFRTKIDLTKPIFCLKWGICVQKDNSQKGVL